MIELVKEDKYEDDIRIDDSSSYSLNQCLKNHSEVEGKYSRYLADAIKELDNLTYALEILSAEIAEEVFEKAEREGNPIPASGKDHVLKVKVKIDPRYREVREKYIEIKYIVAVLKGYYKGVNSRGFRLREICKLNERRMAGDLTYKATEKEFRKSKYESVDSHVAGASELLEYGD